MSWIKKVQYLPGDSRKIQIWNESPDSFSHEPDGNVYGYYVPGSDKWWSFDNTELKHVTHWAEMLGKPEEL